MQTVNMMMMADVKQSRENIKQLKQTTRPFASTLLFQLVLLMMSVILFSFEIHFAFRLFSFVSIIFILILFNFILVQVLQLP